MFEIFPGNYAWSQAALRAMFTGVSPGDVLAAAERLSGVAPDDAEAWHAAWAWVAKMSAARAATERGAGHRISARASFLDRQDTRIFTAEEGGNAHCQNDNRVRAHDEIGDWLTDRLVGQ